MIEDFIQLLRDGVNVSKIVGNRIFLKMLPEKTPPGKTAESLVLHLIDNNTVTTADGNSGPRLERVKIDCIAGTYKGAEMLRRAVELDIHKFKGRVGKTDFQGIFTVDVFDGANEQPNLEAAREFELLIGANVWHVPVEA